MTRPLPTAALLTAALLLLTAFPALALAQEPAPSPAAAATPTPFPAQPSPAPGETPVPVPPEYGGEPAPTPAATPAPAAPEGTAGSFSTAPASPKVPAGFGRPVLAPTFALSLSTRTVEHRPELEGASFDVWLGARLHAMSASATPFVALGMEIDTRAGRVAPESQEVGSETGEAGESWVEVVPEMRMGWAFVASPATDYFNQVFPIVEVYGIAGWRIANDRNGHAARLGVGISSPMAMLAGVACEVPIPAQAELLMDVDSFQTGEREIIFRFGWHF